MSKAIALLGLVIILLGATGTIELPILKDPKIPIDKFALLGAIISAGILILVRTFFEDALSGMSYIRTRNDAQKVGMFPWVLSRYTGTSWYDVGLSYITRLTLAFHPIIYLLFWDWKNSWNNWIFYYGNNYITPYELLNATLPITWYETLLVFIVFIFCTWIFYLSQQFQRPFVFDRKTDENEINKAEIRTIAIREQTDAIKSLTLVIKQGKAIRFLPTKTLSRNLEPVIEKEKKKRTVRYLTHYTSTNRKRNM